MSVLMHMYETKGNPHKDEIVQKVNEYVKTKTTKAEVAEALNEGNCLLKIYDEIDVKAVKDGDYSKKVKFGLCGLS